METRPISLVLAVLAGLVLAPAAGVLALDEPDKAAARDVIARQIDAFRRRDAGAAYAFASPGIQALFGGEERFMAMVRDGYKPVYDLRSYGFGDSRDVEGGTEQSVQIQDLDGVDWDAVYSLERQQDGSWRISGCRLVKRPGDNV